MLPLLTDEHIDPILVAAVRGRLPEADFLRVQDIGLRSTHDPAILEWAAANGRVFVTHDTNTVPGFAYARLAAGQPMAGVIVVDDQISNARAAEELVIVLACSSENELDGRVVFVPLRPSG